MAAIHRLALLVALAATAAAAQERPANRYRLFPDFPTIPGQRGLWIGSLHICRDVVVGAVTVPDRSGGLLVRFDFKPEIQPRLQEETTRFDGRQLPVRLNGRPVSAPNIEEPIRGLGLELHGSDDRIMKKIAAAARRPCEARARP